jgi:hypothetical protein
MQTFRFRLERLLRWQERNCSVAEERVHAALGAVAETETKLAALKALAEAAEKECACLSNLGAADLRALHRFRQRNSSIAKALAAEKEGRCNTLLEERKKLQAERLRLKAVNRIRDQELQEYTRLADKAVEAMAADSYFSRWARTQKH